MALLSAGFPDCDIRPSHMAGRDYAFGRSQNPRRMCHALLHLPDRRGSRSDHKQIRRKSFRHSFVRSINQHRCRGDSPYSHPDRQPGHRSLVHRRTLSDQRESVPFAGSAASSGLAHTLHDEKTPTMAHAFYRLGFLLLGDGTDIFYLSCHKVADEQRYLRLDSDDDRSHLTGLHDCPVRGRETGRKKGERKQGPQGDKT